MDKKEKKYFTLLFVLILITLITMTIGIGFSFYNKNDDNKKDVDVVVKEINLLMQYDNSDVIYLRNLNEKIDYNYTFSIANNSSEYSVKYNLDFEVTSPLYEDENDSITYSLSSEVKNNNTNDKLIKIENKDLPVTSFSLGEGFISENQVHYYTLHIKSDKEHINKMFLGKILLKKAIE